MVKLLLIGKMERRACPRKTHSLVTIAYFGNPPIGREGPALVDLVTLVALSCVEDTLDVLRLDRWTEPRTEPRLDNGLESWNPSGPIGLDQPGTSP